MRKERALQGHHLASLKMYVNGVACSCVFGVGMVFKEPCRVMCVKRRTFYNIILQYKKPLVFLASIASIIGIILIIVFVCKYILPPHQHYRHTYINTTPTVLDHTGNPINIVKFPFTVDSIFNTSLSPKYFSLRWDAAGGSYLYQVS